MNYPRTYALLCCLLAACPASTNADEPERTSWTLTDAENGRSIHVQIQYLNSPSRLWPELWFDSRYSDIPLSAGTQLSISVIREDEVVYKNQSSRHELRMQGRVLIWKSVDNAILPDTTEYSAELHVDGARFLMPNSMAEHFLVKVDPSWGIDRIEPPIVIEDSLDSRGWRYRVPLEGDFTIPPPKDPFIIPIPPIDDSTRVIPIPLWNGKRNITPIPNAVPHYVPRSQDFMVPDWPPDSRERDSVRQRMQRRLQQR